MTGLVNKKYEFMHVSLFHAILRKNSAFIYIYIYIYDMMTRKIFLIMVRKSMSYKIKLKNRELI
jgi:hypothetical protein